MFNSKKITSLIALIVVLGFAAPSFAEKKKASGFVEIDQYHVAFLISGALGDGKLRYKGKTHTFNIGGLGIGGIGVSKLDASGEVYGMNKLSDFSGAYGQVRTGIVFVDKTMGGLWLENGNGVVLHLKAKRKGLMLTIGADVVSISLK